MNAGFSNLTDLKAYVLAASLRAAPDYDAALTAIGLGMAGSFEKFTGRKFARAVAATEIFSADRCQFLLSRFPLESVAQMEVKRNESDGYVVQTPSPIVTIDNDAGIIYLPDNADVGAYTSRVRFTYTGGYFWNQLEPADMGYPTAQPGGSTLLPDDLKLAWLMQCAEAWKKKDKLGQEITDPEKTAAPPPLDFLPAVKTILGQYRRYSLT